jgi:predicted aminopeptidase
VRRFLVIGLLLLTCTGCQIGYYMHSAYHQAGLINSRESIEKVLRKSSTTDEERHKLKLVQDVKAFSEKELGLKASQNYTTYVKIDDPYVTYIVQAAYAQELKPYLWHFPFVGDVPYKGFFKKSMALEEAAAFDKNQYDTYVRGVSAYSTLGWLQDSVLSSMLRYDDYDLAEIIIHETVHTTLFIKSAAEFNERMATFLGEEGMKMYYRQKEGPNSKAFAKVEEDLHDQKIFSAFVTKEIESLKKWYSENKAHFSVEKKAVRLKEIQTRFAQEVRPLLKSEGYRDFEKRELNNAYLLAIQTYEYSLSDFQKLFDHFDHDYGKTLAWLKGLEKDPNPAQTLKDFVAGLGSAK